MPNQLDPVNQQQLEEWGAHCSLPSCNMLDFLPLKCPECEKLFCSSHFKPSLMSTDSDHLCEKLMLKSKNIQPIEKSISNPRTSASATNNKKCSYTKCKAIMFSPITCRSCQLAYCPTHRLAQDHLCKQPASTAFSPTSTNPILSQGNLLGQNVLKKLQGHKPTDQKVDASPIPQSQSLDHQNDPSFGFSFKQTVSKIKVNQRQKSELESKQKALEFRYKNGLLTETDKLELQNFEENSKRNNRSNTNKPSANRNKSNNLSDCCIV